jgi:hypothetical protein
MPQGDDIEPEPGEEYTGNEDGGQPKQGGAEEPGEGEESDEPDDEDDPDDDDPDDEDDPDNKKDEPGNTGDTPIISLPTVPLPTILLSIKEAKVELQTQ